MRDHEKDTWCAASQHCTCILCIYESLNFWCAVCSFLKTEKTNKRFPFIFLYWPCNMEKLSGRESCDTEGWTVLLFSIYDEFSVTEQWNQYKEAHLWSYCITHSGPFTWDPPLRSDKHINCSYSSLDSLNRSLPEHEKVDHGRTVTSHPAICAHGSRLTSVWRTKYVTARH